MERYRGDRGGGGEGGGRHQRMGSRWSSGGAGDQHHRYANHSRGGGEGFAGGRHHPYRGSQDFPPGGGGGFRGGADGFGHQMPMVGPRRAGGGFSGRGGGSPDNADRSKFAKLFIGSVPRTATEEEIRPVFEEHGDVIEVALIKDKRTGQQQGCCFVKYATSEEADRAIKALHNQYTLPGGSGPIQVRYADGERERLGTVEHKLFVGSLNKQATEMEIEEIFSPYGHVEDIYIMRDDRKQSRGCGFVKFSNREMAAAAINALNGTYVMRGCNQPLIVRLADPKRPRPGESRGGPAFGGPGFGPRSETAMGVRPSPAFGEPIGGPPKFAEPMSGGMRPNAWHPVSPESMEPSPQASNQGFGTNLAAIAGDLTTSSVSVPMQQLGNIQIPQTMGFPSISQALPSQQFLNLAAQLPSSQALFQQTATATGLQIPLNLQQPAMAAASSQQQMPASTVSQQQLQQPVQQLPSQLSQALLQQQAQALQLSFQSSQQAISQLQQQLHMMQPSSASQQQNSQTAKQQSPWSAVVSQSASSNPVSTPTVVTSSTNASTTPPPVATQSAAPISCDWSEHTSPDGYKYYYNCVTRESRWEKPEELTHFEQQRKLQKQQKLVTQQLQPPSQAQSQSPMQSTQVSQTQQTQSQVQLRQQEPLQFLQTSSYQASGLAGQQNNQVANSINDSARVQQAMQAGQEVTWKNMTAGS